MTRQKNGKNPLLINLGGRVRALRLEQNLTVKDFAERASLSPRFINQLEAGMGNISVSGLARVGAALGRTLPDLLPPADDDRRARAQVWRLLAECDDADLQALEHWLEKRRGHQGAPRFIALIGLRGAGKSTVGPMLADRLKKEFIELDRWIEEAAGMPLGEIFATHGEGYYRRLEHEALARLFTVSHGCVFAPGGSVVTDAESWDLIKRRCFTVWLHATPEEFMKRMRRAGDTRPMQGRPAAMAELKALLMRRERLYADSQLTIRTTGKPPDKAVAAIIKAVTNQYRER